MSDLPFDLGKTPNLEKFHYYMKDVGSPESFINFGFLALISGCLQRRVWIPRSVMQCFPNDYYILVGPPATGKGQVIKPIQDALRFHEKYSESEMGVELTPEAAQLWKDKTVESMLMHGRAPAPFSTKNQLFPTPANSTSLRGLTDQMAVDALRWFNYKINRAGEIKSEKYQHCSMMFMLEELSSLLKSEAETKNIIAFLITAWDCGNYEHITKNNGSDFIKNCCLSILAGTTPIQIQETLDSKLVDQGFTSRTLYIYEPKPRWTKWETEGISEAQYRCYVDVLYHIKRLSSVFGAVKLTPAANEFMRKFVEEDQHLSRLNSSPKLEHYYSRKSMHLMKLAMAVHFSDSVEMTIDAEAFKTAAGYLEDIETRMHLALNYRARNPLADLLKLIIHQVSRTPLISKAELKVAMYEDGTEEEIEKALMAGLAGKYILAAGPGYVLNPSKREDGNVNLKANKVGNKQPDFKIPTPPKPKPPEPPKEKPSEGDKSSEGDNKDGTGTK